MAGVRLICGTSSRAANTHPARTAGYVSRLDDGCPVGHSPTAIPTVVIVVTEPAGARFGPVATDPELRLKSRSTDVGVGPWHPVASNLAARP
jgi:hypothetical protein